jgi:hypothetical protein
MVADREPVRFVPNALQEVERWGVPGEAERMPLAGEVEFLLALCQRDDWK